MDYLENEIKDPDFEGAAETALFCSEINDMIDICNVKNRYCQVAGRTGVTKKKTLGDLKNRIDRHIK